MIPVAGPGNWNDPDMVTLRLNIWLMGPVWSCLASISIVSDRNLVQSKDWFEIQSVSALVSEWVGWSVGRPFRLSVRLSVHLSVRPSVSQSVHQSVRQSVSQPFSESFICLSIHQSVCQWQWVSQSVSQSVISLFVSQSVYQSISQPYSESVNQSILPSAILQRLCNEHSLKIKCCQTLLFQNHKYEWQQKLHCKGVFNNLIWCNCLLSSAYYWWL